MQPDLTGILLFAFLGGGIVTFIGSIIKFFDAGDTLNFYDEKIHDKNKVSKLVGNDLFYTGIIIILIAIVSIFLSNNYYFTMMITQLFIIIIGFLISCYHFFWKCKK